MIMLLSLRKKCPYLECSGPYFPAFRLNAERYGVFFRIQSECREIQTRINPNTGTFYEMYITLEFENGV